MYPTASYVGVLRQRRYLEGGPLALAPVGFPCAGTPARCGKEAEHRCGKADQRGQELDEVSDGFYGITSLLAKRALPARGVTVGLAHFTVMCLGSGVGRFLLLPELRPRCVGVAEIAAKVCRGTHLGRETGSLHTPWAQIRQQAIQAAGKAARRTTRQPPARSPAPAAWSFSPALTPSLPSLTPTAPSPYRAVTHDSDTSSPVPAPPRAAQRQPSQRRGTLVQHRVTAREKDVRE